MVTIIDHSAEIRNSTTQKVNIFLRLMSDEIIKESRPKTPKSNNKRSGQKGSLRNNITRSVLGFCAQIKWYATYASIQENKQFQNYTTPGTGPHFAENAVKNSVNNIQKIGKRSGLL